MSIIDKKPRRRLPVALAAGAILTAMIVLGAFSGTASADERHWEHRDWHHGYGYGGGYYRAPPVVYGSPYYAPPVVYGPGFGLNINIR